MHKLTALLAPAFGKLILTSMFNPTVGLIGGSLVTIATNHFKKRDEARKAAKAAEQIGEELSKDVMEALIGEGATDDDLEIVAAEIEQLLKEVSLSTLLVDASMSEEEISQKLRALKKPVGLSDKEIGFLDLALTLSSKRLRKLAPVLSGYALERDEVILQTLATLASQYSDIKDSRDEIKDTCETILSGVEGIRSKEERDFTRYEVAYLRQIENLLNYVEVLGLEQLPTSKQEAELSVAYLSLTLTDSSNEQTGVDFSNVLSKIGSEPVRLLIEGSAGSGKSTLLRWAATHLNAVEYDKKQANVGIAKTACKAVEFRPDRKMYGSVKARMSKRESEPSDEQYEEVSNILEEYESDHSIEYVTSVKIRHHRRVRNGNGKIIPILVRLREVGDNIPEVSDIHRQVSRSVPTAPPGWIEEQLEKGRAVVMFDGIDEVPIGTPRDKIVSQIAEFSKLYSQCSIVVTSRPGAFTVRTSRLAKFDRALVEELDAEQQEEFIFNWHSAWANKSDVPEAAMEAKRNKLLKRIDEDKAFRRMATNPLICAAICALHEHDEENIPKDERGLCEGLTRMLVERRDKSQGVSSSPIDLNNFGSAYQLTFDRKKIILARIAAEMLRSGSSSFSTVDLLKILPETVISIGKSKDDVTEICAALVERSGVLRASSNIEGDDAPYDVNQIRLPEGVEFIHNRFKEWLGSTYFLSNGTANELILRAEEDGMAEACYFAASAPDQASFSQSLIEGLLSRAAEEQSRIKKRKLRILALRCANAAPSLPSEVRAGTEKLGSKLLPPKTLEEARALAELGDIATEKLSAGSVKLNADELVPIIRCLSLIDTPASRSALYGFRNDKRWTVINELSKSVPLTEIPHFFSSLQEKEKASATSLRLRKRCVQVPVGFFKKLKGDYLDLSGTMISSIKGISDSKSLKFLELADTLITDFSELHELPNLEVLDLTSCDLTEVESFGFGQNLTALGLADADLNRISGIEECKSLQWLSLDTTYLEDLSPLSLLPELKTLLVDRCYFIEDWSFLRSLDSLEELRAIGNISINSSHLSELRKLRVLRLAKASNIDCANLKDMASLEELYLDSCEIVNPEALSDHENVRYLNLGRTNVESIDYLNGYKNIVSLGLHGTQVSDISAVAEMHSLERLFLGNTRVRDLEPLREAKNLRHLVLAGLDIDDLSPVQHLENLRILK